MHRPARPGGPRRGSPRRPTARHRGDDAVTLVEVLVATLVLLVTMIPMGILLTNVSASAADARQRQAALQLADSWVEILANSQPPTGTDGSVLTSTPPDPGGPARDDRPVERPRRHHVLRHGQLRRGVRQRRRAVRPVLGRTAAQPLPPRRDPAPGDGRLGQRRQAPGDRHHRHQLPEARTPDRGVPRRQPGQRRGGGRVRQQRRQPSGGPARHHHPGVRQSDALTQPVHALRRPERVHLRPGPRGHLQRVHPAAHGGHPGQCRVLRVPGGAPVRGHDRLDRRRAGQPGRDRDRRDHGQPRLLRRGDHRLHRLRRRLGRRQRRLLPGRRVGPVRHHRRRHGRGVGGVGPVLLDVVVDHAGRRHPDQPGRLHHGGEPVLRGRGLRPLGRTDRDDVVRLRRGVVGHGADRCHRPDPGHLSHGDGLLRPRRVQLGTGGAGAATWAQGRTAGSSSPTPASP